MALCVALFLPVAVVLLVEAVLMLRRRLSLFGLFCSALGGAALLLALAAFDGLLGCTLSVDLVTASYAVVLGPSGALLMAALAALP